ncbi:hypothetical protein [Ilumatobacter sp.]|uniref:hypothetical protein n=1 Tax=Ilumatobacter sp. TaxID=1967498 RepID=UPI003B517B20
MRIAHIPSDHPFVRAIDPDPVVVGDPWSVAALIEASVHVCHVHFGFEHLSPIELERWCTGIRSAGIALVHTVHDVDNPHLVDQRDHHARTSVLVRHADALITLTGIAAETIDERYGTHPVVIPHPPIVDRPRTIDPGRAHAPGDGALVWLGTCRPNLDVAAVTGFVLDAEVAVRVVARTTGWEACGPRLRSVLGAAHDSGRLELTVVERPDDAQLESMIASAGVLVLPYAWGTHSGLVELATDLGVPVVTTDVGAHADQGAITAPPSSLAATAAEVLARRPRVTRPEASLRGVVRARHLEVCARFAGRGPRAAIRSTDVA